MVPLFNVLSLTLLVLATLAECSPEERLLVKELLEVNEFEGRIVRPVNNYKDSLKLSFSASLIDIMDFNSRSGIIEVKLWVKEEWKDGAMRWDPQLYSNISKTKIPINKLWRPDMVLYNELTTTHNDQTRLNAVVSHDGTVLVVPTVIYRVRCTKEILQVPVFDTKSTRPRKRETTYWNCPLKFGSWAYDGSQIELNFLNGQRNIDTSDLVPNPAVKVLSTRGSIVNTKYPCCPEPYPSIQYQLKISYGKYRN